MKRSLFFVILMSFVLSSAVHSSQTRLSGLNVPEWMVEDDHSMKHAIERLLEVRAEQLAE